MRMVSLLCPVFLLLCHGFILVSSHPSYKDQSTRSFNKDFLHLFGKRNIALTSGKSVQISLDKRTGSGFISREPYLYAYFSAFIKLQAGYTAGVVAAFYTSNNQKHKNHDEIDFEFLGNIKGKKWGMQTNFYGNGSTSRGREERYDLWFDPSDGFHQYGILWSENHIIFYVDDVPIREVKRVAKMFGDFPSKPMSLYATIWDGSQWATEEGKYKVDYKYAPFVTRYRDLVIHGCAFNEAQKVTKCNSTSIDVGLTAEERTKMEKIRKKYLTYSYCYDRKRYNVPLPECVADS